MNFLMVSPSYPPRIFYFADRLKAAGFQVFGIGDASYPQLNGDLKSSLRYYVQQPLDCYDVNGNIIESRYAPLRRKVERLVSEYGPLRFIESFNEWWLPLDARLRLDFGADGLRPDELETMIKKSKMKEKFRAAGAAVAPGRIADDEGAMLDFKREVGGDLIAKPDRGLGSASTFRLRTEADIRQFWRKKKPDAVYFMEQFIGAAERQFMSFDGLTDEAGRVVFHTAHVYNDGDLEIATQGKTIYYHNLKPAEIPEKLRTIGFNAVKAFGLRKRFFHMEFFRVGDDYYAVELNARPPGFVHLDMMNHAGGIDIWSAYAKVMKTGAVTVRPTCDKVCMQIGRFNRIKYKHTTRDILKKYYPNIAYQFKLGVNLYGDWVCLVLTDDHARRQEILDYAVS